MWRENYDPYFPDQPVVDLYLPIWASQPAFRSKPAFIWTEDPLSTPHRHGQLPPPSSLTYAALNSAASAIASRLLVSLNRGDTVVVLCPPGLRLVKLLFACQRAGLVMVPVIPPEPSSFWPPSKQSPQHHHLLRALSQIQPKVVVAAPYAYISAVHRALSSSTSPPPDDHPFSRLLRNPGCYLSADDLDDEEGTTVETAASSLEHCYSTGHESDDVYLVQYTSGATGVPKPVLVSAGAAAHNVRAARRAYDLGPDSTIVSWLPQYHDCGLMFLLLTVVAGATCVLSSPAAFLRRPRLWLELVSQYNATCTPVPSFALTLVMRRGRAAGSSEPPLRLGSLRNLVLINEPIYAAPVEAFVARFASHGLDQSCISPSYGLAENCTFVSTAWSRKGAGVGEGITNFPSYRKLLPSARLGPAAVPSVEDQGEEMEIMVVEEETWESAEDGTEGEIWVRSPSNAAGYLGHPFLTAKVFGARMRGRAGGCCYVRTGDYGVVQGEERYLYVLGRASDVIRAAGGRVEHPHYLETAAHGSCPDFLRGGCVAAFELRPGSRVVAVVAELLQEQRRIGKTIPDVVRLRRLCFGVREAVEEVEKTGVRVGVVALVTRGSVPKTTSGKLQRWATREKLLRGELPVVYEVDFGNMSEASPEGDGAAAGGGDVDANITYSHRMVSQRNPLLSSL